VKLSRSIAPLFIGSALVAGLVACSASTPSTTADKPAASHSASATPTKAAAAGNGKTPSWASPLTTPGTLLTTATGKGFKVDIYEVGTASASTHGQFADPDTNKPIIAAGDTVVYVNYVFTNTGTASIPLSYSLGTVEPRYADWPYLQGMDSVVDSAQEKQEEVNDSAIAPSGGDAPYAWNAGESFSYGQNFKYEAGGKITFEVTLIPALASGDLDEDNKQVVSVDSTIK
jgi:hypothetical protein